MRVGARRELAVVLCALLAGGSPAALAAEVAYSAISQAPDFSAVAEEPAYSAQAERAMRRFGDLLHDLHSRARERAAPFERAPLATTQLSARDLVAQNVRQIAELQYIAPNLVTVGGLADGSRLILRGVGSTPERAGADPATAIYVDGVHRGDLNGSRLMLTDADRVDVLRGPGPTSPGWNTIAGAIHVLTHRPEFGHGVDGELRAGNRETAETRVSLNAPLVGDALAVRMSLAGATHGAWAPSFPGDSEPTESLLAARLHLLARAGEDLQALLTLDQSHEQPNPAAIAFDGLDHARTAPGADHLFTSSGASLQLRWGAAEDAALTSITAYRHGHAHTEFDPDADAAPLAALDGDAGRETLEQWSQFFQWTGHSPASRFRYVLGLLATRVDEDLDDLAGTGFALLVPAPSDPLRLGALLSEVPEQGLQFEREMYAGYAQGSYRLAPRWDLTLGARLTYERDEADRSATPFTCPIFTPPFTPACPAGTSAVLPGLERADRTTHWSPRAALAYAPRPGLVLYGSYTDGFQGGGLDWLGLPASGATLDPEDLTSYEIGLRSSWLGDRVVANAAAFYNPIHNLRVPLVVTTPGGALVISQQSADRAELHGVELELGAMPMVGLQLGASIGTAHGEIQSVGNALLERSLTTDRVSGVADYTMRFSAEYLTPLREMGTLDLLAAWNQRGPLQSNPVAGAEPIEIGGFGTLDARLALILPDGRTELAAFGSNLLDRRYARSALSFAAGSALSVLGPPRLYGLEIRFSF